MQVNKQTKIHSQSLCLCGRTPGDMETEGHTLSQRPHLEDRSNSTSQLGTSRVAVIPMAILMEISTHFQNPIILLSTGTYSLITVFWNIFIQEHWVHFGPSQQVCLLHVHCFFTLVSHIIYIDFSRDLLSIRVFKEDWETHHLFQGLWPGEQSRICWI